MDKDFKLKNLLFIIPHPDDEIVGTCAIIKRFIKQNKNIYLFFLTNGVVPQSSLMFWQKKQHSYMKKIRIFEMKSCIKELGVKGYFYQDIPTRTLKNRIYETFLKIKKIIKSKNIDALFCPAYEGGHQDHDVSNFICSKLKRFCKIFEFSEYNFFDNKINCNLFFDKKVKPKIYFLTNEEKKFKKKCLKIYNSEKNNLNYINVEKESFRPLQRYNYCNPPHSGILFYRRFRFFSWHPRVDGDEPKSVCEIIKNSKIFNLV